MAAGRIILVHNIGSLFLIWNLILAWVPLWLLNTYKHFNIRSRWLKYTVFSICLAFLPNAPYLMTDLIHLKFYKEHVFWYDLVLLGSLGLIGLVLFFESLLQLEKQIGNIVHPMRKRIFRYSIILLSAYGVYLGRELRLNSWEIISAPESVLYSIYHSLFNLSGLKHTLYFTGIIGFFLLFCYELFHVYFRNEKKEAE